MRSALGRLGQGLVCLAGLTWISTATGGGDVPSQAPNFGGVVNTRHNMTQSFLGDPTAGGMHLVRNDYGEVCVYCHTPHGASSVTLPLWNRTAPAADYVTYDELGTTTLTQPVSQPGPRSLACLSCHDGQYPVDSIINMPGSGLYDPDQAVRVSTEFLDTWPASPGSHTGLNPDPQLGCLVCHSTTTGLFPQAADFTVAVIGTDLRNDHPVGVLFPAGGASVDFAEPGGTSGDVRFFDRNGNGRPDTDEVRLYDSGEGFEVECASCHDPHGVPSAGPGSQFLPNFLRVSNTGDGLCLTCHTK